jgi:SAM-dependent methyltransferase
VDEYFEANRKLWDARTDVHVKSDFYDVEGFKRGRCTVKPFEIEEVGDVSGKRLLHLQCHFGMDTLSWTRLGATVTGADFSERSIAEARALAAEVGIPAEFVCSNVYDLPQTLTGQFDVVFTSAGVLTWLPDLTRWAEVIAHFLPPGGVFYVREFHPAAYIFDEKETSGPVIRFPYFNTREPIRFENEGTYADSGADIKNESCDWPHGLGEIVNALIDAGLRIEFLHEFPYTTYKSHPWLTQGADGLWRYEGVPNSIPLMFSIRATRT